MILTDKPFIIAEMSGNHNQSLERALAIVDAAARAGVQALKIQTYTAETMTLDASTADFMVDDPHSLWLGESLYGLYQKAYTPWEWHKPIFQRCNEHGIIGFSTPFDETAVDFLESLGVPCYKVASFEVNHIPLLRTVARTGKPVILSTGMASLGDLELAVSTLQNAGCKQLILLKCTSSYPADPADSNLLTIPHMRELYHCEVGLSDHTLGIGAALASVALGVRVIEKHFTLSRAEGGVDAAFSLEPQEMQMLVEETLRAHKALGTVTYGVTETEKASLKFRRSIYVSQDINEGDVFSKDNLRIVRPGYGLSPKYYEDILGKVATRKLKRGVALKWDMIGTR